MPLLTKRFAIWQRIYERYLLEPLNGAQPTTPQVSEVIVPVINADTLLRTPVMDAITLDLDVATGTLVIAFTVPEGQEWELVQIDIDGTTANHRIRQTSAASAASINISLLTTSQEIIRDFYQPRIMQRDDTIGVFGTNNAGDANRTISIYYNRIDLT